MYLAFQAPHAPVQASPDEAINARVSDSDSCADAATDRVSEGAETDEATYVDAARSALGSASRALV